MPSRRSNSPSSPRLQPSAWSKIRFFCSAVNFRRWPRSLSSRGSTSFVLGLGWHGGVLFAPAFSAFIAAQHAVFEYIEVYYNRTRKHSYLKGVSPARFESCNQKKLLWHSFQICPEKRINSAVIRPIPH